MSFTNEGFEHTPVMDTEPPGDCHSDISEPGSGDVKMKSPTDPPIVDVDEARFSVPEAPTITIEIDDDTEKLDKQPVEKVQPVPER